METANTIWKPTRLSGNYPDSLKNIWRVWKLSGQSRNCPFSVETVHTEWTRSGGQEKIWNFLNISLKKHKIATVLFYRLSWTCWQVFCGKILIYAPFPRLEIFARKTCCLESLRNFCLCFTGTQCGGVLELTRDLGTWGHMSVNPLVLLRY